MVNAAQSVPSSHANQPMGLRHRHCIKERQTSLVWTLLLDKSINFEGFLQTLFLTRPTKPSSIIPAVAVVNLIESRFMDALVYFGMKYFFL